MINVYAKDHANHIFNESVNFTVGQKGHLFWEVFSIGGHSLLAKWECLTCNFPQIFYASCNFLGMKSSIPLLVFS